MPRSPRPWFRFYVEAVHDRKLRRLKPETRWLFVACLAAARQSPEPGWLLVGDDDPMGEADLADFAAMASKQVASGLSALARSGVMDFDKDREAWFVPNWNERQFESDDVAARTAKHRGRNVPTSLQGTPSESDEVSDPTKSSSSSTPVGPNPDDDLWNAVAKRQLAQQLPGSVRNAAGWLRTASTNARLELGEKADGYRERYDLSEGQLVDALLSPTAPQWLNTCRRPA